MYGNNTDSEAHLIAVQKGLGQWQQTGVKQEQNRIPWVAVGFFFSFSPVLYLIYNLQFCSSSSIPKSLVITLFP